MSIYRLSIVFIIFSFLFPFEIFAADAKPKAAIFIQNRAGEILKDKVDPFNDIITARLSAKGFTIIDKGLVRDKFKEERNVTVNSDIEDPFALLDQEKGAASALSIAKSIGADYIVSASLVSLTEETKTFRGKGTSYQTDNKSSVITLRMSLKVLDSKGGSLHADQVSAAERVVVVEGLEILSSDIIDRLLEKGADKIADNLTGKMELIKSAVPSKDGLVSFSVKANVEGAAVELDGLAVGSTPGTFKADPGIHQIRITRQWFETWERSANIFEGQSLNLTLELSKEGIRRFQNIEGFKAELDKTRMRTGAEKLEREAGVEIDKEQSTAEAYRKKSLADGEKKRLEESYERIEGAPAPKTIITK